MSTASISSSCYGLPSKPEVRPTVLPDAEPDFGFAMGNRVHDNLGTFFKLRGGRMRSSSIVFLFARAIWRPWS